MNKTQLIQAVADKLGLTKAQTGRVINAVLEELTQTLNQGERVNLMGFGTFEPKLRPARMGHNPKSLAPVEIPATRTVSFHPGSDLKEKLED